MSRRRLFAAGTVGGLVHFVVIGGLYAYLRGPELWGYHVASNSFALFEPIDLYLIAGTFLLGVPPAVLWAEHRLVTPTLTIVAVVIGALLASPVGLERIPRHQGPPGLFGFYFIFWFAPLITSTVMGGIEYGVRWFLRKNSTPNGPSTSGGNSRE